MDAPIPPDVEHARHMFWATAIILIAFLSPIFGSFGVAIFKGRGVRGRWLFAALAPVLAYTGLWVFTLVFFAPAYFILTWFAPALKDLLNHTPYWYPVFAWVVEYEAVIAAVACSAITLWLIRYLWPRWPGVLSALLSSPKKERTHETLKG